MVKHWFKVSVKHRLVLVCFYMREVSYLDLADLHGADANYTNIHRKHCSNLKNLLKVTAGFNIWGVWWHVHASAHAWNIGDMQKKAHLVWLKKLPGVQHIARLKQQSSLSFPFYQTQRENHVYLFVILLVQWWK